LENAYAKSYIFSVFFVLYLFLRGNSAACVFNCEDLKMNIVTKQAQAVNQSAVIVASDALRLYKAAEDNMQSLLGAAQVAREKANVSGNAQDKAAATRAEKAADKAVSKFKAAARALNTADKAAERAKAAYAKAQHAQDTKAATDKAAATAATKGKLQAKPLTEKAVHDMVIAYVSGNMANMETARSLDAARKDNTARLQACAAAIPSQDRLISWALEIIKANYTADQERADGKHKCKDAVAALKRLGAAYIAANKAAMDGLVFTVTALDRKGNYAVKFEAAKVETDAEKADKAEKQAAKDWAAFVAMAEQHGISEAQLLALKVKNEAEAIAAKANKAAARKAAKLAA
jgi:hypothetical protein